MKDLDFKSIVQDDVKAAGHGHDQLLKLSVPMGPAFGASRHIIQVIDPLDIERDVPPSLDESQIAARVSYFGQVYDPTVHYCHVNAPPNELYEPGCRLFIFVLAIIFLV
jgi:hypothetical protein